MKKQLLIVLLFVFVSVNQAQTLTVQKTPSQKKATHEVGLSIYRLDYKYADLYFEAKGMKAKPFRHFFVNGLHYRFFNGQHGARLALNYYQYNYVQHGYVFATNPRIVDYTNPHVVLYQGGELIAGYQFRLKDRKLTPYATADLSMRYSRETMSSKMFNPDVRINSYYSIYNSRETTSYGVCPGIGVRYNPIPHLVFSAETCLQFYKMRSTDTLGNGPTGDLFGITMRPLQVALGFSF